MRGWGNLVTDMNTLSPSGSSIVQAPIFSRMKVLPSLSTTSTILPIGTLLNSFMKQLKAKLYEHEMAIRNEAAQAVEDTKSDIGWGSQIRSYVLDDSRIKDLRTGVENRNTQSVLDGNLDPFIEASLKKGL